jgi:UDP-N-acetylmuramate--alanine ligase
VADIHGYNYICKNRETYFSVEISGKTYPAHLKSIGKHNVENALSCIATAHALGFKIRDTLDALEGFSGVKRRLELVYKSPSLSIYDDYAHNPSKIKSVLNALRTSCPESNIIVIFQPHRYSRIKTLYNNFVGSFSNASFVIVLPTYSSGEQDDNPILTATLSSDIEQVSKVPCFHAASFDSAQEKAAQTIKNDSIIITLGAGDVWHLAFKLKERLG